LGRWGEAERVKGEEQIEKETLLEEKNAGGNTEMAAKGRRSEKVP